MRRRYMGDESNVGLGAMIMFISSVLVAAITMSVIFGITEKLAQAPQETGADSVRSTTDRIIIHEVYVWDEFDNYGIIWELAPGSAPKLNTELYWILQCTDDQGIFWRFWGDFTSPLDGAAIWGMDNAPREFGNKSADASGLEVEFFDNTGIDLDPDGDGQSPFPPLTHRIPDIIGVATEVNYGQTNGAFAGAPYVNEFSTRHTGYVLIEVEGDYTFYVTSDDGSRLYVDGEKVVNNPNQHPMNEESGTIHLSPGMIPIVLEYFEQAGQAGLILQYEGPGIAKMVIPNTHLFRDGTNLEISGNMHFEPGTVYEISIDQRNGNSGATNPNPNSDTCGPKELFQHSLRAQLYLIVGGGGMTHVDFRVPDITAGTRLL